MNWKNFIPLLQKLNIEAGFYILTWKKSSSSSILYRVQLTFVLVINFSKNFFMLKKEKKDGVSKFYLNLNNLFCGEVLSRCWIFVSNSKFSKYLFWLKKGKNRKKLNCAFIILEWWSFKLGVIAIKFLNFKKA